MVKTSPFNARGTGSIPGQGAKILHALQPKKQNTEVRIHVSFWIVFVSGSLPSSYSKDHCNTIYNSQEMESTYMSINRWIGKEVIGHVYIYIYRERDIRYIMEYYSAIKGTNWVSCSKVDETRACYIEWSQKEKHKYLILTHTYDI